MTRWTSFVAVTVLAGLLAAPHARAQPAGATQSTACH
jgi:hypothetical protein